MLPLKLTAPVRVIPNGVDLAEVNPASIDVLHQAVPGIAGRPYVLFLSRLHYKKGLDYLIDAFARVTTKFPDIQLLVVGADDGGRAAFAQRVAELGLTARLDFPAVLRTDQVARSPTVRAFACRAGRKASASRSSRRWRPGFRSSSPRRAISRRSAKPGRDSSRH